MGLNNLFKDKVHYCLSFGTGNTYTIVLEKDIISQFAGYLIEPQF